MSLAAVTRPRYINTSEPVDTIGGCCYELDRQTNSGARVATIDLREASGDQIVIHYGGALASVDAYTFANSLISFSDVARAVNDIINPGQAIEIRIEALGPGSFRAIIRKIAKDLGGFFSRGAENVFWAVISYLIIQQLWGEENVTIHIADDQVVIQHGDDSVIVSRDVYEQSQNARQNPEIQRNVSRTFDIIANDEAIEDFGLTPRIADPEPLVRIPRADFPRLASPPEIIEGDPVRRWRTEDRARLIILKAWLRPGRHKWSFEWNGVPISARVSDQEFLHRLYGREYLIGAGDALDVRLRYQQAFDETLGVYVNDQQTFEVVEVLEVVPRGDGQRRLATE